MTGQLAQLARRSVLGIVRQPAEFVPALAFPLIFLALMNAGVGSAARLPGFPSESYLAFILPAVLVQGAMFGGVNSGSRLAIDIEDGFLRRLSLTAIQRWALLLGHLSGSMAVALVQGVIFVAVGLIAGVEFKTGLIGAGVLIGINVLFALAFSSIGAVLAVRIGSSEAVQSSFPLFFIIISFSSFFIPRDLITATWFRAIATANPASYVIEAGRSVVITGWDAGVLLTGVGAVTAVIVVALAAASRGLRTRLV